MMICSKRIQVLRVKNHLSQELLAEKLHVSRQAVAKWESGQTLPDLTNLLLLSELFKVTLDYLLKEDEDTCTSNTMIKSPRVSDEALVFLFKAKQNTYAANAPENIRPCRPNAHDLTYEEGEYLYIDTYLGSEKFSGQEALWHGGVASWTMNYCGRVISKPFSGAFLKKALIAGVEENRFRGPLLYSEGHYTYHCEYKGNVVWFNGYETIYYKGEIVYECNFHGGIVVDK